ELVRPRRVPTLAAQDDLEIVFRRHDRPDARLELADRKARRVVQAVDLVEGETREEPVVEHGERAPAPFLGGLEDEAHGAVEAAFLGEKPRGAEERRGVAVMAAGVHGSGYGGA